MACPVCGGMNREPIAPGFWRCTSMRVEIREFGGPGLADPRAGPGLLRERHETVCGAEYQEGGLGLELACACGTFAIGRCVVCFRPVCGHHSGLSEGVRLCEEHLEAEQTKRRAAHLEMELRAQAGREDAWLEWEARAAVELARSDSVERVVRYLRLLSLDELRWLRLGWAERRQPGIGEELRGLLPDLWSGQEIGGWNDDDVAAWWLRAAKTPPGPLQLSVANERRFLASRRRPLVTEGWTVETSSPTDMAYERRSLAVLADGRRGSMVQGACLLTDPAPGFSAYALWRLGDMAQLAELPPPPEESGSRYGCWRLWGV